MGAVVATMATMPGREESAVLVARTLLRQVQTLHVCFDCWPEPFPPWVSQLRRGLPKGKLHTWAFSDQIGDGCKFFWADQLSKGTVHLLCDDDILYPDDYAATMQEHIAAKPGAAVGVHGIVLDQARVDQAGYYEGRAPGYPYTQALEHYRPVHVLGTGTLAYRVGDIDLLFERFRWRPNVADLLFARTALEQRVPMLAVPRPEGWLRPLAPSGRSIWESSVRNDGSHLDARRDADAIARTTRWPRWPAT